MRICQRLGQEVCDAHAYKLRALVAKNGIGGRVGCNDFFILSQGENGIERQVTDGPKVFCLPVESVYKFLSVCDISRYTNGQMSFF